MQVNHGTHNVHLSGIKNKKVVIVVIDVARFPPCSEFSSQRLYDTSKSCHVLCVVHTHKQNKTNTHVSCYKNFEFLRQLWCCCYDNLWHLSEHT